MAESKGSDQSPFLVGIAITGSRKSKYVIKWALEKFLPEGNVIFKLINVYPKITLVPTPMGTWMPVAQVREEVVQSYRQETEWKKQRKFIPYLNNLRAQKIKVDLVLLESDDIPMALSLETARKSIRHLVIGLTSTGIFSMRSLSPSRGGDLSQVISENVPDFCSVYVIGGDGKLQQLHSAVAEAHVITMDDTSNLSSTSIDSSSSSSSLTIGTLLKSKPSSPKYIGSTNASDSSNTHSNAKHPEYLPKNVVGSKTLTKETEEFKHYTFMDTQFNSANAIGQSQSSSSGESVSWVSDRTSPGGSFVAVHFDTSSSISTPLPRSFVSTTPPTGSYVGNSPTGTPPRGNFMTTPPAMSPVGTPPTGSYASTPPKYIGVRTPNGGSYVGTPPSVSFQGLSTGHEIGCSQNQITELEKLRIELRHIEKFYELSQNSANDKRLNEISKERLEEAYKLRDEKSKALTSMENKYKNTQNNKLINNKADSKAAQEAEEIKNKLKGLFVSSTAQYQKFTWEEIMEATSSLSDEFKIGMGAFGTVYKCKLHYTTVAIKVLHSKDSVTNKQFVQELEILSTIRHPHLLLLLGAVPEESCLVYEYMDHGSLDDRLFKKNGKPPLPWYDRFRICYEVAGALAFLHSTTPRPIIHRDLKPANILLDHNLVSKIGDAGLGTMINVEPNDQSLKTIYKETSPVGTLCYIDPEYQRTGRVSTKSDIYALGIVILQLLTAKHAVGIAYVVEDAIDEATLTEILDPEAGKWPEKETLELALLALQCAELRGRDRPDIREKILPMLERLTEVANSARELASSAHIATPPHYFCPILKDVMEDPYVAADGYTYERRAIEQWLNENDTSPITKQSLPHKFIMPNTSLLEAIKQWKSNNMTT